MKMRNMVRILVTAVAMMMVAAGSALASSFSFPYSGKIGNAQVDSGVYNVTWVQNSPDVTVTVGHGKGKKMNVVATVQGRMENRDQKYERNMVVYNSNSDGSQTITELRIGGTRSAIVFDK